MKYAVGVFGDDAIYCLSIGVRIFHNDGGVVFKDLMLCVFVMGDI